MKNKSRAFTLIELLVVVLIIGILAAVAVPQYQKAVAKSRLATFLPLAKAVVNAKEVYYMQNGAYTRDITALGVDVPASCSFLYSGIYACGNDIVFGNNESNLLIRYCPGNNVDNLVCAQNQDLWLLWTQQHFNSADTAGLNMQNLEPGVGYCVGRTSYGRSICKSMTELTYKEQ